MLDLLVIGAGLSGMMAAYAAATAGQQVRIVSKGLNALHWSAGTIDVLGYLPGNPQPVAQPLAALDQLFSHYPTHPYSLLGPERLVALLARFQQLTVSLGLPYAEASEAGSNLLLPSAAGAVRPTFLAPLAQLAGDLSRPEPLLIVGFAGLRDFYPELIAENLRKQGYAARAALLPLELITDRSDYNPVQLAQSMELGDRRQRLGDALHREVQRGERIGLPALLGLEDHAGLMATLALHAGAPVFEIPTLPPSVPGYRLFHRLRAGLRQLRVSVQVGMEVIQVETGPDGVKWVATETSARPLKHYARHFLLATGGILGGGINSAYNGRVWETVFDLPLTTPQDRSKWFHASFLSPEGHPVFEGGVPVNRQFQPVDKAGEPVYHNLRAAGTLLAGADPIQERSLEGLALATGLAAAEALLAAGQTAAPAGAG